MFDDLAEHVGIRIYSCHDIWHDRTWSETKAHPDYDMWIVTEGRIVVRIGDTMACAQAGDAVFFYPHMPYTATAGETGCRFLYIHFEVTVGEHYRILDDFPLAGIVRGELLIEELTLFRSAYERCEALEPLARIALHGCFTLLLARIIACYGRGSYVGGFSFGPRQRASARNLIALQPLFAYIHRNLHHPLKVSDLASAAGMSEKYFITRFREALGITPRQYVQQLKINKARDYLYQNRYTVKEIAHLLGFPDPYTFSKAFKKHFGIPPSRFFLAEPR